MTATVAKVEDFIGMYNNYCSQDNVHWRQFALPGPNRVPPSQALVSIIQLLDYQLINTCGIGPTHQRFVTCPLEFNSMCINHMSIGI